jgi:hypothetical protein
MFAPEGSALGEELLEFEVSEVFAPPDGCALPPAAASSAVPPAVEDTVLVADVAVFSTVETAPLVTLLSVDMTSRRL